MKGTFRRAKETTPLRKYHYSNQYTQNNTASKYMAKKISRTKRWTRPAIKVGNSKTSFSVAWWTSRQKKINKFTKHLSNTVYKLYLIDI